MINLDFTRFTLKKKGNNLSTIRSSKKSFLNLLHSTNRAQLTVTGYKSVFANHRYVVKREIEFHPTLIYRSNGSPNDPIKEQKNLAIVRETTLREKEAEREGEPKKKKKKGERNQIRPKISRDPNNMAEKMHASALIISVSLECSSRTCENAASAARSHTSLPTQSGLTP